MRPFDPPGSDSRDDGDHLAREAVLTEGTYLQLCERKPGHLAWQRRHGRPSSSSCTIAALEREDACSANETSHRTGSTYYSCFMSLFPIERLQPHGSLYPSERRIRSALGHILTIPPLPPPPSPSPPLSCPWNVARPPSLRTGCARIRTDKTGVICLHTTLMGVVRFRSCCTRIPGAAHGGRGSVGLDLSKKLVDARGRQGHLDAAYRSSDKSFPINSRSVDRPEGTKECMLKRARAW